jgi:hypothetical protein
MNYFSLYLILFRGYYMYIPTSMFSGGSSQLRIFSLIGAHDRKYTRFHTFDMWNDVRPKYGMNNNPVGAELGEQILRYCPPTSKLAAPTYRAFLWRMGNDGTGNGSGKPREARSCSWLEQRWTSLAMRLEMSSPVVSLARNVLSGNLT